jgi:hypothetical protein
MGHRGVLADFAQAIRGVATPGAGADALAGLYSTWMALGTYEAARTGVRQEPAILEPAR